MKPFEILHLIYDGQCALCVRAANVARAVDRLGVLRFYDVHEQPNLEARFPMLRGADLDAALYVVTEGGRVYRGFFACRRLVWSSPLTWPLLPLFYFPGSGFLGARIYAWVARNRRAFGCSSPACVRPVQPEADQAEGI
jgi:predicted DCC family thiol-disulfide oxidoreductase YuxK